MKNLIVAISCCLVLILGSCSSFSNEEFYDDWDFSTPTRDGSINQVQLQTPTLETTKTPTLVPTKPKITQSKTPYLQIYSEGLNPNWELITGNEEEINLRAQAESHEGFLSIAIMPTKSFSNISFVVREDSKERYPLSQILGIQFWINPEDYDLSPSDIGIIILGSNEFPYYVKGKTTVANAENSNPSTIHLDEMGYNENIPAKKWTELIIQFDGLVNYRDFENLVGISISNDSGFLQTIYMDQVELILRASASIPTREPTSTYTQTPIPENTATITPTPTPTPTSTSTRSQITPYTTPEPTSTKKPSKPKPTKAPTKKPTPTLAG